MKVAGQRRRPHIELKFTITTNYIARTDQLRRRIDRVRIVRSAHPARRRHRPPIKLKWHRNAGMKIQTLHNRRCDYRSATGITNKSRRIEGGLFTADAFRGGLERIVNGKILEPAQQRRSMIERDAGELSDADLRI